MLGCFLTILQISHFIFEALSYSQLRYSSDKRIRKATTLLLHHPPKMKLSILIANLLLSTLTLSSPLPVKRHNSSCPQIFALTVSTPNTTFTNLSIIQSGRSTYLSKTAPTAPDTLARFYRNDTTHLYATGFNTSYLSTKQTPPYQLLTLSSGFNIFSADPIAASRTQNYINAAYVVSNTTSVPELDFVPTGESNATGGWWVCGVEGAGVWGVEMGVQGQGGVGSTCTKVTMRMVPLKTIKEDVC